MPTQDSFLGPISGNKGRKKATCGNSKGRKRVRSVEARYNAALELAIEENNDKAGYIRTSEKEDDEDHYDLAMEEPAIEPNSVVENKPTLQNIYVPETPMVSASPASSTEAYTPTKSRNPLPFERDVTIDSPKTLMV